MYRLFIKRAFDIVLSLIGLLVFALPMLVVAILIRIDDPGPAVFRQKRVGQCKNGEIRYFYLYKFRSMKMTTPHDVPTHLLKNPEQYMLTFGKTIRKLSIDELPQLVNILKGDMSIIGPRPALWTQEDLIAEREKYGANDVKPGLTGWAQINGRDELEIPIKAKYDGEYVRQLSFRFDCKCFFKTIGKVIRGDGVVEGSSEETSGDMDKPEN